MINKQELKFLRSLHLKKFRDENNMYIAEGLKTIDEAINNQATNIDHIYLTTRMAGQFAKINNSKQLKVTEISDTEFTRISMLKNPPGILAVIKKPSYILPKAYELSDLTLLLDQISDPGNMGTIIRLADWFGISNIICSVDTVECFNPKVVQASMGSLFRVKIFYTGLNHFIQEGKNNTNLTVYGTTLQGNNIYEAKLKQTAFILLGNEARGLSEELLSITDENLLIPNYSISQEKTESLNVSVAAAILCSEFRRQNHSK